MNKEVHIVDETLNINSTSSYTLGMQLGVEGFSYSVLDSTRNKFISLRFVPYDFDKISDEKLCEKFLEVIDGDEYLNCKYKQVRLIIKSNRSILVPNPLFEKDTMQLMFRYNHPLEEEENLVFNKLKNIDSHLVFAIPLHLYTAIYTRFASVKLFHQATPFIEHNIAKYRNRNNKQKVCLHIMRGLIDILVVNGNKLQLYNSFQYKTADDLVYFTMFVYDQLSLNPENTELIISGFGEKNSEIFNKLKKYIKNINFEKRNETFQFSYTFNDLPTHAFTNLINVHRCE